MTTKSRKPRKPRKPKPVEFWPDRQPQPDREPQPQLQPQPEPNWLVKLWNALFGYGG